jgi:hypothetical protein
MRTGWRRHALVAFDWRPKQQPSASLFTCASFKPRAPYSALPKQAKHQITKGPNGCWSVLHSVRPAMETPQSLVNFYWRQRRLRPFICASAPRQLPRKSDVDYILGLFAPLRPFLVERSCGGHGRRFIWHEVVETAPHTWRKGFGEVKDARWLSPTRCDRLVCNVITRY